VEAVMARFTFRTDEGVRTVSAPTEDLARKHLAFLTVHPEPTATAGNGMTAEQARAAKARLDRAAEDLTLIHPAR
jgi:hypothetical protein